MTIKYIISLIIFTLISCGENGTSKDNKETYTPDNNSPKAQKHNNGWDNIDRDEFLFSCLDNGLSLDGFTSYDVADDVCYCLLNNLSAEFDSYSDVKEMNNPYMFDKYSEILLKCIKLHK